MPTRFVGGVTQNKTGALRNFPVLSPTNVHIYFNDFDTYAAGDWTVTETSASGTQALSDTDGGALVLTNAANDDFLNAMQLVKTTFLGATGKKMWGMGRLKVSDATQSDVIFGLQLRDTSPLATAAGIWLYKADGAATWTANVSHGGTATTASSLGTLSDGVFTELGFYYNGKDEVEFWIDGAKVATLATTNFPVGDALCPSFAVQNGAAAAKVLTVDYVMFAKER